MSEIQELEAQKEDLKAQVELRDQILKLSANHEFRKVIHEEFFQKEAGRLVRIGGDPSLDKQQRQDAIDMALATGHLNGSCRPTCRWAIGPSRRSSRSTLSSKNCVQRGLNDHEW